MKASMKVARLAPVWVGALAVALALVLAPGIGQARGHGGSGGRSGGGERSGGTVRYKSGGNGGAYRGGSNWGGSSWGRSSWGGSRGYVSRGGAAYRYRSPRYISGSRYGSGYGYRTYVRPRYRGYYRSGGSIGFGIGIGLGYPYYPAVPYGAYCPYVYDSYPRVVERTVIVHDHADDEDSSSAEPAPSDDDSQSVVPAPDGQPDVENLPPAGCYYFDPYCGREFASLDDYTAHLDANNHGRTVEVIQRDSKRHVRTLEFNGDYWSIQP